MMNDINLPKGWKQISLGKFMDFKRGFNTNKNDYGKGIKFINVTDVVRKNHLFSEDVIGSVKITEKQLEKYSVVHGDILFNRTSETAKNIGLSSVYLGKEIITFGGFVIRGRQTKKLLIPEFAKYCFNTDKIRKKIIRCSQGTIRANISQKDLAQIKIIIPTLADQKMIASILSNWDIMLEQLNMLINAKELKFNWLITNLINKTSYKEVTLDNFIKEVTINNKNNETNQLLSITNHSGFVLSKNHKNILTSSNINKYKIIKQGEYAYNPSRIHVGSIARLDDYTKGIVSSMYRVFKVNEKIIDADYFLHWISSNQAKQKIKNKSQGAVRANISFKNLKTISMPLPNLSLQNDISKVLNMAKDEINLLKKLVNQYQLQQKFIMEKLLLGNLDIKN